ncbi:TPA_asm: hypothetical protein [Armillaria novae-zelandiae ambi-like virus 1]|uniref:Uncharacterized protein n=1 Tax=Armillaria novae-zelandiae ambi-like virus 1 TaxID=2803970 RepID=A0A8D9PCR3_9VIRU|nr:TPA_asm: hypothetical protein [Armillaria novae-zelandiae ambi-like virus 1]
MSSIRQGFKTLASTESGMYLQHLTFCIDLSLRCGGKPLALIKEDGSYIGCLISVQNATIMKNNRILSPTSAADIPGLLQTLSQHEIGMRELIEKLNDVPAEKREKFLEHMKITESHLSMPRQIHNLLRRWKFSSEEQSSLLTSLKKLSFTNEYWSPRDLTNIERVASAISNDRFLDETVPMPYNTSVVFTNDIYLSSLGAFGKRAPALSHKAGELAIIPHSSKKTTILDVKLPSGRKIPKIGIYMESLQEAAALWKEMKVGGVMKFSVKKNDLIGAFWSFPKGSPSATMLSQLVTTHFGKSVKEKERAKKDSKKRKDRDEHEEEGRKKRKVRSTTEMDNLLTMLGLEAPDQGDASADEEDSDAEPMEED